EGDTKYKFDAAFHHENFSLEGSYLNDKKQSPLTQVAAITPDGETRYYQYGYAEARYDIPVSEPLKIRNAASYDLFYYDNEGKFEPPGFSFGSDRNGDGIPETWPNGAHGMFGVKSDQYRGESILDYQVAPSNRLLAGGFFEITQSR